MVSDIPAWDGETDNLFFTVYTNLAKGQQLIITCILAAILFIKAEEKGYIYL